MLLEPGLESLTSALPHEPASSDARGGGGALPLLPWSLLIFVFCRVLSRILIDIFSGWSWFLFSLPFEGASR